MDMQWCRATHCGHVPHEGRVHLRVVPSACAGRAGLDGPIARMKRKYGREGTAGGIDTSRRREVRRRSEVYAGAAEYRACASGTSAEQDVGKHMQSKTFACATGRTDGEAELWESRSSIVCQVFADGTSEWCVLPWDGNEQSVCSVLLSVEDHACAPQGEGRRVYRSGLSLEQLRIVWHKVVPVLGRFAQCRVQGRGPCLLLGGQQELLAGLEKGLFRWCRCCDSGASCGCTCSEARLPRDLWERVV